MPLGIQSKYMEAGIERKKKKSKGLRGIQTSSSRSISFQSTHLLYHKTHQDEKFYSSA